jgi:hypothetical protein
MSLQCEVLPDRPEGREKSLCAFRVAKAAHAPKETPLRDAPLAFTRRLVVVLRPVVQSRCRFDQHVLHAGQFWNIGLRRRIAAQLISNDLARHWARPTKKIDKAH